MKIKKMLISVATAILTFGMLTASAFATENMLSGYVDLGRSWGGEFIEPEKFVDVEEGDTLIFEYIINNEDSYHLVQIASGADAWPILECSTQAVNNQDDAEFKNENGGFAVVSVDGSVSYTLTSSDVEELEEYGMVVRGYDITVKSITIGTLLGVGNNNSESTVNTGDVVGGVNEKGNPDTGVAGLAGITGITIIAALGLVITKRK